MRGEARGRKNKDDCWTNTHMEEIPTCVCMLCVHMGEYCVCEVCRVRVCNVQCGRVWICLSACPIRLYVFDGKGRNGFKERKERVREREREREGVGVGLQFNYL